MELQEIPGPIEACDQDWCTCDGPHYEAGGQVIALYRQGLERVQAAELKRLYNRLPQLNERSRLEVRQFADRLVATMLHPPLESLRDESHDGSHHALLEALQRLFRLNE